MTRTRYIKLLMGREGMTKYQANRAAGIALIFHKSYEEAWDYRQARFMLLPDVLCNAIKNNAIEAGNALTSELDTIFARTASISYFMGL